MSYRLTYGLPIVLLWIGLGACSTATVSPPATSPPPDVQTRGPPSRTLTPQPPLSAEACLIGRSCLELDPRPFVPCLVSTPDCARDAEVVRVRPDHTAS
jgi:hypothetical protein